MGVDWGTGSVEFRGGLVWRFENDGIVWYDASKNIERAGWQKELEPYEGPCDGLCPLACPEPEKCHSTAGCRGDCKSSLLR